MSDSGHDVDELRKHLFETLRALRDEKHPMDIERAKAISDTAQTIINSAKVEVEFIKNVGGAGSGFIPSQPKLRQIRGGG